MLSISLVMLSNSLMAEKSLPNPNPPLSPLPDEMIGAPHALDVVVVDAPVATIDPTPELTVAKPDKLVEEEEEEAAAATLEVGVGEEAATDAAYVCLKDGGIMARVSSLGRGFPLTFSATRNMASANCSALRRPVLEISQRFLKIQIEGDVLTHMINNLFHYVQSVALLND